MTASDIDAIVRSAAYAAGVTAARNAASTVNDNPHGPTCGCPDSDRMPCDCCVRTVGHRTLCPKGART